MKMDSGKVVVITGASRGIGKETALAFARKKATVVLASRDEKKMREVAGEIQKLGSQSLAIPTDVSVESSCRNLIERTMAAYGRIDVLVNNAGYGHYASVERLNMDDLEAIFRTNLFGSLWCIQAVLPHMKARRTGHIVNVSTVIAERSVPYMSAYCMTKFAMNAMDESLRLEVRKHGIDVSLVCPGLTKTDFQTNAGKVDFKAPVDNAKGMSPQKVGQKILEAVETRRRRVYLTTPGKLIVLLQRIWPGLVDEILFMIYSRRKEPST